MNVWKVAGVVVFFFILGGCYTRFASLEPDRVAPGTVISYIDSSGKEVKVVRRIDTIKSTERETCIWERDLIGLPYLRCYKGYYPSQWYMYNHSPWWYRNSSHLYSAGHCPPYYYFDRNCGCCRHYLNNPDLVRAKQGVAPPHVPDTHSMKTSGGHNGVFTATSGVQVQSQSVVSGSGAQATAATQSVGSYPVKKDSLAAGKAKDSASANSTTTPEGKSADSTNAATPTSVSEKPHPNDPENSVKKKPPRRSMRSRQ